MRGLRAGLASLALVLSLGALGVAGPARAAGHGAACTSLVAVLDTESDRVEPLLARQLAHGPQPEQMGDVIFSLSYGDRNGDIGPAALACWHERAGGPVAPRVRKAVERASGLAFKIFLSSAEEPGAARYFSFLNDAFSVERATGLDAAISRALRAKGLTLFLGADSSDTLDITFYRASTYDFDSPWMADRAVLALAALCIARPKTFRAAAHELGFTDEMLAPRPSRLTPLSHDGPYLTDKWTDDPLQRAFRDAEMDRVLKDCPV